MRRSREDTQQTRRTIVEAASRLFREKGIGATSVADVMASLGLTVGGFYRHFQSKEALVGEAIDLASLETTRGHAQHLVTSGKGRAGESAPLEAMLRTYLSEAHRAHPARGCPVAALCSEVGHEARPTKEAFTKALVRLLDTVNAALPKGSKHRRHLLHTASAAVGALVLARATSDEKLARELMSAVRGELRAATADRRKT